jgi:hypothetical protein
MKTIPQTTIDAVWEWTCELSETDSQKLVDRMQQEHPSILAYLLAMEEETEDREQGWLLELGCFIFSAMSKGDKKLQTVTGEQLEAAEEQNSLMLEKLDGGSEKAWMNAVSDLIQKHNQAPLLRSVVEMLMADDEDAPELDGEYVGAGLLYLKTVIDCLDQ